MVKRENPDLSNSIDRDRHVYCDENYWNDFHATDVKEGISQKNVSRFWLTPFLSMFEKHKVHSILDLGCGLGYDAIALAKRNFAVTGIDYSETAIHHAQQIARQENVQSKFQVWDIAQPLPFPTHSFDAIISNLVLHSFPDLVVRSIFSEVERCLKPAGLFLFHVNSIADIPHRTAIQAPAVELSPNFYRLGGGQTMHFFSEDYCRELLSSWILHQLEPIQAKSQKRAWRCIAQTKATAL